MSDNKSYNFSLPLFGLALAIGLIVSTFILSKAVKKAVPTNQVVKVRGVAEEVMDLDKVKWRIEVTAKNMDLEKAYEKLEISSDRLVKYLNEKGFDESEILEGAYSQTKLTKRIYIKNSNYENKFLGWEVKRDISIENSAKIDLVFDTNKVFTSEAAKKYISANSNTPKFYTDMNPIDLKKRLLENASKNAYLRASIIAKNSGSSLGGLRAARQGDYTGITREGKIEGDNRKHRVTSIITVDYALD